MDYKVDKPIYLQIADYVCERILQGVWKADERIPSVRELSVTLEVNPNTIVKSFEYLENKQIIFQKRGIGYFVESNGLQRIQENYKTEFLNEDLPNLFKKMHWLEISIDEIVARHAKQ
ncbi:MAG: GntR family transcriptional regulator [Bacteroidales bacterium]|jgi:DNA-binding transcriptional regulator YhcF (GntR family)|nr:GntR family transcriptional regulator [Bacteroidales bacterium]